MAPVPALSAEKNCSSSKKHKVVVILGSTGTGKTKLSIDLAIRFSGEIINSDKIHAQNGLDIASNRVTKAEAKGIPHHILEVVGSDADFTIQDFVTRVHDAIDHITSKPAGGCTLPIIVGCSNSYIEALVEGHYSDYFKSRIDPCFLWIDIDVPVLYRVVEARVDRMIASGLLDEVRDALVEGRPRDVTKGVWRTIGFEEFQTYFKAVEMNHDEVTRKELFDVATKSMKERTCKLVDRQLGKIQRLRDVNGWDIHRIDATKVAVAMENNNGTELADSSWEEVVLKPSYQIVSKFLDGGN
ncbi:unnamed protein product [Linum trigynum]|uniref:Uncharacterized protein n=1 Tax=Linum trigynum TaxID=586398 RepID=A0AAV2FMU5_9ROSI